MINADNRCDSIGGVVGAIFGYFNTALTFHAFFNKALVDPLYYAIYQGARGTTPVYFIGYSMVAHNPLKHTGIAIVGGIGKVGFAITLMKAPRPKGTGYLLLEQT